MFDKLLLVVVLAFLIMLTLVGPIYRRHWLGRFCERYHRIDDEEFIRRCGPGVSRHVAITVRRIISERLGIEYERVHPEQSLLRDLDCE